MAKLCICCEYAAVTASFVQADMPHLVVDEYLLRLLEHDDTAGVETVRVRANGSWESIEPADASPLRSTSS